MLTTEQQTKLVQAAKAKNPNITFEETKAMLSRANGLTEEKPKSKGFLKDFASGISNAWKNPNPGAIFGEWNPDIPGNVPLTPENKYQPQTSHEKWIAKLQHSNEPNQAPYIPQTTGEKVGAGTFNIAAAGPVGDMMGVNKPIGDVITKAGIKAKSALQPVISKASQLHPVKVIEQMLKTKTLNPGKAMGAFGTEAAEQATKEGTKFSKALFYDDVLDRSIEIASDKQRLTIQNKIINDIVKETGIEKKLLKNLTIEEVKKILPDLFKGGNKAIETALGARRSEASSAFAGLIKSVLKPGSKQYELIRNSAYNEQLKKVAGIKLADESIQAIKAIEKIVGPYLAYKLFFGNKGGKVANIVETATSL